jgi:hypothetical protein
MKHAMIRKQVLLPAALVLAAFAACDGGSKVGQVGSGSRPELASVELGRLVDVYAYRRIDPAVGDRRLRTQRQLHRVARNVVINANIDSQPLFDAAGQVVATANYEFLPFDKNVGHEELVILWDDRPGAESDRFQQAFDAAQQGLLQVPASYRGQSTQSRPIPIVARNAAIRLRFTGQVDVDQAFFTANPSAIQLLEFKGDPSVVDPADAFRILPYRVIPQGDSIILDTTILAGEANGGLTSSGLPQSSDPVTANIRIAIPSRGSVVPSFYIKEDSVEELNDIDSAGRAAVIRDFRSGNLQDGAAGRVREPEAPMIVASLPMGIQAIDAANGLITLNKRLGFVPIRGRYPFVDGPLNANGIPLGPLSVPIQRPLSHGDILTQTVQVTMPDGSVESVTLKAEVLQNRNVGTVVGDPLLPRLGLAENTQPGDSGQSELDSVAVIRVATVSPGVDSLGRPVSFRASTLPAGEECLLRAVYHEEVPFVGSSAVLSDRPWRSLFTRIEPRPAVATTGVAPNASVAVEFTKPMDLDQVDNTANYLITSQPVAGVTETFEQQMTDPKRAKTRIVPTRLSDITGDGTVLRLQPPMGFFHRFDSAPAATGERYSVHVRTGTAGVTDLAGNPLQLFDSLADPQGSWSVEFALAPTAPDNLIGYIPYPFEADDEDGTLPGSADIFGQYRLANGRLTAAAGVRFSRSADQQNLATISRITRGECWFLGAAQQPGPPIVPAVPPGQRFPQAPVDAAGAVHPGLLYWRARMSDSIGPNPVPAPSVYDYWQTQAQPVGRVIEPMKPQGSRMQMRYIEDDFSLSYRQPSEFGLDVEQLYWSPFNKESVQFDVFDRFTMSLSHARRRTDEFFSLTGQDCILRCASMNSSLVNTFSENVLEGADVVPVFQDKVYRINPNDVFRTNENEFYVPFPRFDRTYTWRDSRLVTVDSNGNVIGLGGAQQPQAVTPNNDFTANIDSPWITDGSSLTGNTLGGALFGYNAFVAAGGSTWVMDSADFVGTNQRDHDPIAMPLLVDFMVFPDDAANGLANGSNGFQVAMLGPPSYGFPGVSGYYDTLQAGCIPLGFQPPWPRVRVHASGGFDLITGNAITIDPANQLVAQASVVKDAGLGAQATALFTAPPGDGMLNWARADFVRKVSTMTFGFFDTLQPQRAQLLQNGALLSPEAGFPNLLEIDPNLRISDLVVQIDPPQARQPAGTSVVVELRGAESFGNSNTLYNPSFNQLGQTSSDTFDGRGNLLNANYACEAYRYSTANAPGVARVAADGLTRYVTEDQLGLIRNPATSLLPRFMNLRLVMTNNVSVSPALSPSLRSMGIVYRLQPNQ